MCKCIKLLCSVFYCYFLCLCFGLMFTVWTYPEYNINSSYFWVPILLGTILFCIVACCIKDYVSPKIEKRKTVIYPV